MARGITISNDERNPGRRSYWVYNNAELALGRLARTTGRDLRSGSPFDPERHQPRSTAYVSPDSVVSIGLIAHERLADVISNSLIYLDPQGAEKPVGDEVARIATSTGRARSASRTIFLGRRARQAAALLPELGSRHYNLPPLDLSDLPKGGSTVPRLTIVNHLADAQLARTITDRFLDSTDFFLECIGVDGERHNRVRYLKDADVSDVSASVHVHIGVHSDRDDRLRICDSWQSNVPVLFFDVNNDGPSAGPCVDVRNEYDVLVCKNFTEASAFLSLLLDTPALRRILTANGRNSAAPAAAAWDAIALDLAA